MAQWMPIFCTESPPLCYAVHGTRGCRQKLAVAGRTSSCPGPGCPAASHAAAIRAPNQAAGRRPSARRAMTLRSAHAKTQESCIERTLRLERRAWVFWEDFLMTCMQNADRQRTSGGTACPCEPVPAHEGYSQDLRRPKTGYAMLDGTILSHLQLRACLCSSASAAGRPRRLAAAAHLAGLLGQAAHQRVAV